MGFSTDHIPAISVVVPSRNEKNHIEATVRSILAQKAPAGGFEVIVADGMSEDGTREILNRLAEREPCLRIIDNPNRIVSTGLNSAIRVARGEVIIRIDAHTEYAPDYVRECVGVLEKTDADNVGGPARTKHEGAVQAAICAAYHSAFSVGGARFHNVDYEGYVDTLPYGCWRRKIFDQIGFFDEELVRNQDDEFNLRLTSAGGKIWQSPRIKSWYKPRASLKALFIQYMQYGYWKVRILQKHKIPASLRHLVPGSFVFCLIVLPLLAVFSTIPLWIWLSMIGLYVCCNLIASLVTSARKRWTYLPILPLVFACYHVGYGIGFIKGVIDFVILRRVPSNSFTKLTRSARSLPRV
jgi:succinoglycan biosynthesis protein ExoA